MHFSLCGVHPMLKVRIITFTSFLSYNFSFFGLIVISFHNTYIRICNCIVKSENTIYLYTYTYGGTEVTCVCFYLSRAHDILSRVHELLKSYARVTKSFARDT